MILVRALASTDLCLMLTHSNEGTVQ